MKKYLQIYFSVNKNILFVNIFLYLLEDLLDQESKLKSYMSSSRLQASFLIQVYVKPCHPQARLKLTMRPEFQQF